MAEDAWRKCHHQGGSSVLSENQIRAAAFFDKGDPMQKPLVIGHRGAKGLARFGNTRESFEIAIALGLPMMELDVRRTRDGELICHHDPALQGKLLGELTYAEILHQTFTLGYEAPRLEEVLHLARGRIAIDVELKEGGYEDELADLLLQCLSPEGFVVKSFHDLAVYRLKQIEPGLQVGLLVRRCRLSDETARWHFSRENFLNRLRMTGADFLSPQDDLVDDSLLEEMRRAGKPVFVWTVNEPQRMRELMAMGVDAIITDRPDLCMDLMKSRTQDSKITLRIGRSREPHLERQL